MSSCSISHKCLLNQDIVEDCSDVLCFCCVQQQVVGFKPRGHMFHLLSVGSLVPSCDEADYGGAAYSLEHGVGRVGRYTAM